MQCPRCGSPNAPGQEVCFRCGSPLTPMRGDPGYGQQSGNGGQQSGNGGQQNGSGYSAHTSEPLEGVWREEWPALGGAEAPAAIPPWLAGQGSAPPSTTSSAPQMNGSPAQQDNGWGAPANIPSSAPFPPDSPSQYPGYYGDANGQRGQQVPLQQPPMFMVNPPDIFPPDRQIAPYGVAPVPPVPPVPPMGQQFATNLPVPYIPPEMPIPAERQQASLMPVLTPGTALKGGRYRIIQRFVSGSANSDTEPPLMAATDTEFPNQRVLVQEIPLGGLRPDDAEFVRRDIADRLESLSQVAGIAHLRDSFVEQRRSYLVFEMPSGDRLLDRMQRAHGPLAETTVIGIALQVLEILTTLQRSPIPVHHGNITPANIILRPGGQVALVGLSPTLLAYPTGQVPHGAAGALSHYSAPEQARGNADVRSDIFALCAVMHHAVTGVEPVGSMYPLARHANPAVSLELEDILGQGLRPSPGQRFQTTESLYQALAPLASGRRLTHVDENLDDDDPAGLRPLRDAQGRLVGPRQRLTQNPLFFVGIVLILVALLGGGVLYAMQPRTSKTTTSAQTLTGAFAPYYQSKGIGLSGGEFVFDSQQPDFAQKQKGALALGAGDIDGALRAYQQAAKSDPSDVEALIYSADLSILADKSPYITVIAGVAFGINSSGNNTDSADTDQARYELQGIYLAQLRFNAAVMGTGHYRMRVLILNSGQAPADAQLASALTIDQIHKGNVQHIIGIVGWPGSNQSRLAMAALGASGLPVISPTADAYTLEDTAANFFAMSPADTQQAVSLATAAATSLQAKQVLVVADSSDQESSTVAKNFSNQVNLNYITSTQLWQANYDAAAIKSASDFQSVADAAFSHNVDLIYLVGDQTAAILLADEVSARAAQTYHTAPHILIGPQQQMASFYGIGNDAAALAARANPNALQLLYIASLASPNVWQTLNLSTTDIVQFDSEFSNFFSDIWGTGQLAQPNALAILSYDATNMLIAALGSDVEITGTNVTIPAPQQITTALQQFTPDHPFMGLGGAASFTKAVHQPNKALSIFALTSIPGALEDLPVVQMHLVAVIGGKPVFCGQSSCQPY